MTMKRGDDEEGETSVSDDDDDDDDDGNQFVSLSSVPNIHGKAMHAPGAYCDSIKVRARTHTQI